jgi:hypothetical protein
MTYSEVIVEERGQCPPIPAAWSVHRLQLNFVKKDWQRLTDSHDNAPEDYYANDTKGRRTRSQRLSKRCKDDNDKFQTIHPLSADDISQDTKPKLTNDSATRSSNFDSCIGVRRRTAFPGPIDHTKHGGQKTHCEDVIGICEDPTPATTQART